MRHSHLVLRGHGELDVVKYMEISGAKCPQVCNQHPEHRHRDRGACTPARPEYAGGMKGTGPAVCTTPTRMKACGEGCTHALHCRQAFPPAQETMLTFAENQEML